MSINDHKDTIWTAPESAAIVPMLVPMPIECKYQGTLDTGTSKKLGEGVPPPGAPEGGPKT